MTQRKYKRRLGCIGWGVIAYLTFAAYAWWNFTRINHDGLANLGLFLITAPIALLDAIITAKGWGTFQAHGHGYLLDNAYYYVSAVLATALLLALVAYIVRRMWRWLGRGHSDGL